MLSSDARFDTIISIDEGDIRGRTGDPQVMFAEHKALLDAGLLDFDQPTPYSHWKYQQRFFQEFTPEERMTIRLYLGMVQDG
jgi:hypothetical protein